MIAMIHSDVFKVIEETIAGRRKVKRQVPVYSLLGLDRRANW